MTEYITLPNITRSLSLFVATTGTVMGLRSFISPAETIETFGLPKISAGGAKDNPLIPLIGARNIAGGLTIYALAYQRKWTSVGTTLLCGIVTGLVDAAVVWKYGTHEGAWGHWGASVLIAGVGGYLVFGGA